MKNLLQTSILIIALCVMNQFVSAQIIYTDVNPDSTSTGSYNLDLNNDGIIDFVISHGTNLVNGGHCGSRTSSYINVTPSGSNQVVDYSAGYATNASKLPGNTLIDDSTLTWSSTANQAQLMANYEWYVSYWTCAWKHTSDGQWASAVDGFLGLKLIVGGNTYYGWVLLNTAGTNSFTIRYYAYNSAAGQGILIPTATITAAGATTTCTGPVILNANTGTGFSYQWYNTSSGIISGATSSSYTASVSGSYYAQVTNSNGISLNSNSIALLIGSPVASVSPLTGSVCHGNPVILSASPVGTGYSYQWMKNSVDISGATSQTYSANQTGPYSARVTVVSGGCNSISPNAIITRCGHRQENEEATIEIPLPGVYPNPVSNSATISFSLSESQKVSLKIFDVNGRLIKTLADKIIFEEGEHQIEFNAEKLNAGIYFLKMQAGEFLKTEKLIVTK